MMSTITLSKLKSILIYLFDLRSGLSFSYYQCFEVICRAKYFYAGKMIFKVIVDKILSVNVSEILFRHLRSNVNTWEIARFFYLFPRDLATSWYFLHKDDQLRRGWEESESGHGIEYPWTRHTFFFRHQNITLAKTCVISLWSYYWNKMP